MTTFDVPLAVKATSADAICAAGVAPASAPGALPGSASLPTIGGDAVALEGGEANGAVAPPLPNAASVVAVVLEEGVADVPEAAADGAGEEL